MRWRPRSGDGPADQPVGPFAGSEQPIVVMRYTGAPTSVLGERFATLVADAGTSTFRRQSCLDTGRTVLRTAVGAGLPDAQNNVTRLGIACIRLADDHIDARKRQREFDRLQRLLLRAIKVDATVTPPSVLPNLQASASSGFDGRQSVSRWR